MTAFEGLFLTTNRHAEAREVLLRAGQTVSDGMLANTADTGALEYNTADAALWFLHAIGRYVEATADVDIVAVLADKMDEILNRHLRGTRYGIVADPTDGLLLQGEPGVALTWMDARVDGLPVTGRQGKAVEINALWVEGLAVTAELFARLGRSCDWGAAAERATASFRRRFPRPDNFGLYDVVDGTAGDDPSVRPNQLLAVSLPHGPITDPGPVEACRAALLTSIGLRSLAPGSPGYQGRHRGGPAERDRAYHQGTVWPWLIGPFTDAALRVGAEVTGLLDGLELHLGEWGLGSVSETADGDRAPRRHRLPISSLVRGRGPPCAPRPGLTRMTPRQHDPRACPPGPNEPSSWVAMCCRRSTRRWADWSATRPPPGNPAGGTARIAPHENPPNPPSLPRRVTFGQPGTAAAGAASVVVPPGSTLKLSRNRLRGSSSRFSARRRSIVAGGKTSPRRVGCWSVSKGR